jgi:hypothetical protein
MILAIAPIGVASEGTLEVGSTPTPWSAIGPGLRQLDQIEHDAAELSADDRCALRH